MDRAPSSWRRSIGPAGACAAGLALAAVLVPLTGCEGAARAQTPATTPVEAGAPLRLVEVARVHAAPDATAIDTALYVERDVRVAARDSGVIAKVLVDRGARVKAGDTLAQLETDVLQHQLEIAQGELRLAEEEVARHKALAAQNIESAQEYRRFEITRDLAASRAALAQSELERADVKAPFDGVVIERWAVVGMRVNVDYSTPLFRIAANQALRASIAVPEVQLGDWTVGRSATVRAQAGGASAAARIVWVAPAIDPASGTAHVIVELTGAAKGLRAGAAVTVSLSPHASAAALVVPARALVQTGDQSAVVVVQDGIARRRTVARVEQHGDDWEVSGGALKSGDMVVVSDPAAVTDGERVRIGGGAS